jgi:hypothetical protein
VCVRVFMCTFTSPYKHIYMYIHITYILTVEDAQTQNFYMLLSKYVTYFISFLALYLFSFTGTKRYRSRRAINDSSESGSWMPEDRDIEV